MTNLVVCIWVSLLCCSYATKEPTVPDETLVYKNNPWKTEHHLPISDPNDELCGIWVNLTATWQPEKAPHSNGVSTIGFNFEHPSFKETIIYTMEVHHNNEETIEAINICFSKCPTTSTEMTKQTFTLHVTTDDIQKENPINVKVSSEESHDEKCYIRYVIKDQTNWKVVFVVFVAAILSVVVVVGGVKMYSYFKASKGDHGLGNGSTSFPNNDLIADTATSSGAANGAGPDEILIKSARDDRRSGRGRKPHDE